MAHHIFTDLDMEGNLVQHVADAVDYQDAVNLLTLSESQTAQDRRMQLSQAAQDDKIAEADKRLDNFTIIGDGNITALETFDGEWHLNVKALTLGNTYTGDTGIDAPTINADLLGRTPPVIATAGDLYINNGSDPAFAGLTWIENGLAAPLNWTEMNSGGSITLIKGRTGEISVLDAAGPTVTIGINPNTMSAIKQSTTDNSIQDALITVLQETRTVGRAFDVNLSSGTEVVIPHHLGTSTCTVQAWVGGEQIQVNVFDLTTTHVTVQGIVSPALASVRVVIVGLFV